MGFKRKQSTPEQITLAADMVSSGLSFRKPAETINKTGGNTSHMTVFRWAESYAELMTTFAYKITPQVGEAWRTDEIYLKIKGNRRYLFAMLDSETKFCIAKMVA